MGAENIYQIFSRIGSAGFFVRRDSWGPTAAARIVSVGGMTDGLLPGPPPYHADPITKKNPVVMAEISNQRGHPKLEELSCPGTYAYTMIDRPEWWTRGG